MSLRSKGSKIKNVSDLPLSILSERRNNGPFLYPVLESDSQDVQRRRMKDSVVGLKHLLGGEVAWYGGVNLEHHRSGSCIYSIGIGAKMQWYQGAIRSYPRVSGR